MSVKSLGYQFEESARDHIGHAIAILVKFILGVNIRANIFRMEKQNITISNECSGFRAQFCSPRSEFIYNIIEISHALK